MRQAMELARQAVVSTRAAAAMASDHYTKGVTDTLRTREQNLSEPGKGFSPMVKARIQGFCEARTWDEVPKIWHEIEKCKTDEEVKAILERHWNKIKVRGDVALYDIYWVDELLEAIRKAIFCAGDEVTFLTSMAYISMLNMMPWSKDDEVRYENERKARKRTTATRTYTEEKKMKEHARYPPTSYEKAVLLLTTDARFLEMLFTTRNKHQQGIVAVRNEMMRQSRRNHTKGPLYYMQVVWGCMRDWGEHFSQLMTAADFEGGAESRDELAVIDAQARAAGDDAPPRLPQLRRPARAVPGACERRWEGRWNGSGELDATGSRDGWSPRPQPRRLQGRRRIQPLAQRVAADGGEPGPGPERESRRPRRRRRRPLESRGR